MQKILRYISALLLLFVGLIALGGGWMLMLDPSGESIQIPIELLDGTPFQNYFIPGVILFNFIGIVNVLIALIVLLNKKGHPRLLLLAGIILLGWLGIELLLNPSFYEPILHIPLLAIATVLILMAVLLSGWEVKRK